MKETPHFKKRRLCLSPKGSVEKLGGWPQVRFTIAIVVILFTSLLFSCSSGDVAKQAQATLTQPVLTLFTPTTAIEMTPSAQLITLVPEPSLTPMPTSSITPEPIPTLTALVKKESVIAAMVYADIGDIVLVDSLGNPVRTIHLDAIRVAWSPDGCQLHATVTTGKDIRLLSVDLAGQVLQELFVGGSNVDGGWQTSPALSPTGEWVAYAVWSGERYRIGAEFQDIEVVAVGEQANRFSLTERGGAWVWGAAWSPDGARLAFSDYDKAGIAQVYHSRPDGSDRYQLTRFTTPGLKIGAIKWSLDGHALAFATYYDDGLGGLWIVSSDGRDLRPMIVDSTSPIEEDWLWWSTDGNTLIAGTRGYVLADGLYWFDVGTGEILHTLSASETPYEGVAVPFPIADVQKVGFMAGDNNFYQYNLVDSSIELWADQETLSQGLFHQVSPVPNGPVELNYCLRR